MKDEIKEILEALKIDEEDLNVRSSMYQLQLTPKEQKILLNYITNLQTIEQQYSAILSENAELENKTTNLQEEKDKYKLRCYKAKKMIFDNYGLLDKYGIEMLEDILDGKSDE